MRLVAPTTLLNHKVWRNVNVGACHESNKYKTADNEHDSLQQPWQEPDMFDNEGETEQPKKIKSQKGGTMVAGNVTVRDQALMYNIYRSNFR